LGNQELQVVKEPVFYILVVLVTTSAMISAIFFIAWKSLVQRPYVLTWSLAFFAATCEWLTTLARPLFPSVGSYWLAVNFFALALITLGLRGHCQRTNCSYVPGNLWPIAGAFYLVVVWTSAFSPHVGMTTAVVPAAASVTLFLSAWIVLTYRDKPRPAEIAAAASLAIVGVLQVLSSGIALMQGVAGNDEYRTLYIEFIYLTLPAGYIGIAMFTIFMLASDMSEKMKEIAVSDQLTGLLNRRGFNEQGSIAYATSRRADRPVSVIMTDIDRFKDINDRYGHAIGDDALVHFAGILCTDRRADDVIARVGGEEFALVLPGTELRDAIAIAEELCASIERKTMDVGEDPLRMTASFGVSTISRNDTCLEDIVLRADRALYRSKRAGRNRVDIESSQALKLRDGVLVPDVAESPLG
jgi:diguanylate cyclase (GGDEF)-like protein